MIASVLKIDDLRHEFTDSSNRKAAAAQPKLGAIDKRRLDTGDALRPHLSAIVVQEIPFGGTELVFHTNEQLNTGDVYLIKVEEKAPIRSQLVWIKYLGKEKVRAGFEYLG